jgi:PIN domain nuclease of toxin-antitoxin system
MLNLDTHVLVFALMGSLTARVSTSLDFRGDPADEIIAATSVVHRVRLLTRDRAILRSKLVPFA